MDNSPFKNTKDLAPVTFPSIPNHLNTRDYFQSLRERDYPKLPPVWDAPGEAPAIKLIQAQRDLHQALIENEKRHEHNQKVRRDLHQQWQHLGLQQNILGQAFEKFDEFVRNNEEKRNVALRKIEDELQAQDKWQRDIEHLQKQYDELEETHASLQSDVERHAIYETYLTKVVDASDQFTSINHLINRYEALSAAKNELSDRQSRDLETLEYLRGELSKLKELKETSLQGMNNNLAELHARFEKAKVQALYWQEIGGKLRELASLKNNQLQVVEAAVWNVYVDICQMKGTRKKIQRNDTEKLLTFIKQHLLELRAVLDGAKAIVEDAELKRLKKSRRGDLLTDQLRLPNIDVLKRQIQSDQS